MRALNHGPDHSPGHRHRERAAHDPPGPDPAPAHLRPTGGAAGGTPCPATVLSWDGDTLVAADPLSGRSVRLTPAALYHYRCAQKAVGRKKQEPHTVEGLAALDADGLVLLDLPGRWEPREVSAFAAGRGTPVVDALAAPSERVRAVVAGRAPGWGRLSGLPASRLSRGWKLAIVGTGVAGLLAMAYVTTMAGWLAWRGLAWLGATMLDLLDGRLAVIFFSPPLLLLSPVRQAVHTVRLRRGTGIGTPGGARVFMRGEKLRITAGPRAVPDTLSVWGPEAVMSLMVYRHEDLRGLFMIGRTGRALRHLPGLWHPEHVNRFAVRHGLRCEVRTLDRREYLDLVTHAGDAVP
ncbi:hypothetical protein ACFFMN_08615 [Planobispora siamensis]|uniref:Uncharacterized protein n=1 Tax=Planobispora siamensis TaxID=936338 RepID=A0A8J3WIG7_9ACTN|nr:hypothetical protein [Planobispora siamensis]GIH90558.1 hypothetical protein Psi01_11880 [Planobispora siamensis]